MATIILDIIFAAAVIILLIKTLKNFKFRKGLESSVAEVAGGDISIVKSDNTETGNVEDTDTKNE